MFTGSSPPSIGLPAKIILVSSEHTDNAFFTQDLCSTLSVRIHSVRATADTWKVYLSLLEVQTFPKAFGDESGTSFSIPQILGDTARSLSVSRGSVLERKILSSPWDPMREHPRSL